MSDWTPRGTPQVNFRAGELQDDLEARMDAGRLPSMTLVAKRDLDRYYALLRLSLPQFTVGDASLIVDAMNGTLTEPHTASLLWANVADALPDGLAEKWHVDGEALVARLRKLTPFEALSVCDAAERYWASVSRGAHPEESHELRLRRTGLIRS